MSSIYNYTDEFNTGKIKDDIEKIEEKIEEEEQKEPSKERDEKITELTYAQLMKGLRLSTGYYNKKMY